MAFAKPEIYELLLKSEDGKDILEKMSDKEQKDFDEEVEAFFEEGGKGYSLNAEYLKAKEEKAEEDEEKEEG